MNKQRLRDMSLGFLLCLALIGSYYCGASGNPTNANASSMGSSDYDVVGGMDGRYLGYAVVDKSTGKVVYSEMIDRHTLPSHTSISIGKGDRYW